MNINERVIFVTGKGGVGKTSISISISKRFSEMGKRVLLCDLGLDERVTKVMGIKRVGYNIRKTKAGFYVIHIEPEKSL